MGVVSSHGDVLSLDHFLQNEPSGQNSDATRCSTRSKDAMPIFCAGCRYRDCRRDPEAHRLLPLLVVPYCSLNQRITRQVYPMKAGFGAAGVDVRADRRSGQQQEYLVKRERRFVQGRSRTENLVPWDPRRIGGRLRGKGEKASKTPVAERTQSRATQWNALSKDQCCHKQGTRCARWERSQSEPRASARADVRGARRSHLRRSAGIEEGYSRYPRSARRSVRMACSRSL